MNCLVTCLLLLVAALPATATVDDGSPSSTSPRTGRPSWNTCLRA